MVKKPKPIRNVKKKYLPNPFFNDAPFGKVCRILAPLKRAKPGRGRKTGVLAGTLENY
jgi:hypothetical protein